MTDIRKRVKHAFGTALIYIICCGPPNFCGTRNMDLEPPLPLPKPLSAQERRKLSVSSTESTDVQYLQRQSLLFSKLPTEVRVQIFKFVLGNHSPLLHMKYLRIGIGKFIQEGGRDLIALQLLSLPLSCRRAYTESLPLLYTHSIFRVGDPDVIIRLPHCFLPQRLAAVRKLELYWNATHAPQLAPQGQDSSKIIKKYRHLNRQWKEVWATLVEMKELKVLVVALLPSRSWAGYWAQVEPEVLAVVTDAGTWKVEDFEIRTSWAHGPTGRGDYLRDAPFRMVRIPDTLVQREKEGAGGITEKGGDEEQRHRSSAEEITDSSET